MPELNEILLRCKNGDTAAYRQVVEAHQSFAYSLALRILCDAEDARDVVQESFVRVWQNIDNFDPKRKFTTWLYKIITNLCLDYLKARKRKSRHFISLSSINISNQAVSKVDIEKNLLNQELIEKIETLAEGLTPKQRIVFVFRDLQNFEIDEIVKITGLTKERIKGNLYYARMNIRAKLATLENET